MFSTLCNIISNGKYTACGRLQYNIVTSRCVWSSLYSCTCISVYIKLEFRAGINQCDIMPFAPELIRIIFILYFRPFVVCIKAVQDHAVCRAIYLNTVLFIHFTKNVYNFCCFGIQFYFCAKNHWCIAGYIKFIIVCSVVRCSQSSLECQHAALFSDRCRNVIFHFQCSRFRRLVFHCNIAWYYCGFSGYRCCIRKSRCCDHRICGNWRSRCLSFFQCFDRICQCSCNCLNFIVTCLICNSFCSIPRFFECLVRILCIFISRFYFFCICKCCCQSFTCFRFNWCFFVFTKSMSQCQSGSIFRNNCIYGYVFFTYFNSCRFALFGKFISFFCCQSSCHCISFVCCKGSNYFTLGISPCGSNGVICF